MSSVYSKLAAIQAELKAPKSQYNEFGQYNYRSCEDILEAVKPLAKVQGCVVLLSDEPVVIDGWHYIKAEARLIDEETGEVVSATAYAREPESKKGMDASQITGSTSSYARKYALSGLFALDDTKDADGHDNRGEGPDKRGSGKPPVPTRPKETAKPVAQRPTYPTYRCANCGKPFVELTDHDGRVWTPKEQYDAAASVARDGEARCKACREKLGE